MAKPVGVLNSTTYAVVTLLQHVPELRDEDVVHEVLVVAGDVRLDVPRHLLHLLAHAALAPQVVVDVPHLRRVVLADAHRVPGLVAPGLGLLHKIEKENLLIGVRIQVDSQRTARQAQPLGYRRGRGK